MEAVKCPKCNWVYWTYGWDSLWGQCPKCDSNNDYLSKDDEQPELVDSYYIHGYYKPLLYAAMKAVEESNNYRKKKA